MDINDLRAKSISELRTIAKALGIKGFVGLKKADLLEKIAESAVKPVVESVGGIEEIETAAAQAIDSADVEMRNTDTDNDGTSDLPTVDSFDSEDQQAVADQSLGDVNMASEGLVAKAVQPIVADAIEIKSEGGNGSNNVSVSSNITIQSSSDVNRQNGRGGNSNGQQNRQNGQSQHRNGNVIVETVKVGQNGQNSNGNGQQSQENFKTVTGILEIMNDGTHGIIRTDGLLQGGDHDAYIPGSQIKRFGLRPGDLVAGPARPPKEKEKYMSLVRVDTVGGKAPAEAVQRRHFSKMTPIFPERQIKLETTPDVLSTRIMDLLVPVGFGQRGMIVAQPKSGKTWLLMDIAHGIAANHPEAKLIVVLVGERPEEVTYIQRSVKGEVFASNFDEPPEHGCRVAELALEKAKRMVEKGEDVIILMDSITRLARAYNLVMPTSGRTLSGGFDPVALYPPKKFFGAARNFEEGGSLTIIATALVDTGSRMDDLVFEEFKGTGNMEIHLDRVLSQRRIFPAIDIMKSATRNEDKLLSKEVMNQSWRIRRMLEVMNDNDDPTALLISRMKQSKSNTEFLAKLHE